MAAVPASTAAAAGALPSRRGRPSSNRLRHCSACSAERSEAMLVALGAQITLQEFVAGRTALRLRKACSWLRGWCAKAEAGICSPASLIFLATSWAEARKVDGNSDWLSFLNGKAFINRLAVHDQLLTLLAAQEEGDGLELH